MNKFFKILSKQKTSSGFTLVELMVAMLITSLVISATGFGLITITNRDKREKAETERRVELNRALDFIADEVRQAKPIATNASANLSTIGTLIGVAPNFSSSGKTPVLTLQIPKVSQRVIYYIASSSSLWLGPNVVYRWGPNFNADGTYSNPTTPANWTYEPLADLIVNTAPSPTPSCDTNWTLNPSSGSTGFYACVDSSGRIADIHLRGKLSDAYGNSRTPLEVNSKVFARPDNSPFTLSVGSSSSAGNGGTVTITQPSTAYFEILGGDMLCPGVGQIPTTTTINVTDPGATAADPRPINSLTDQTKKARNVSADVGTKLTVTGFAKNSICSGTNNTFNSEADKGTQVWTLRNGDTVPSITPFTGQAGIDTFLTKFINTSTGKVKLADNQVIYLFELYTTNPNDPLGTYDMQDLIVLATIVPTQSN